MTSSKPRFKIPAMPPDFRPRTDAEIFAEKAARPALKPMGKPCHDCAITCGFYTPYADMLSLQPAGVIGGAARSWFCHNHPNRGCRGVLEYLHLVPEPPLPPSPEPTP